MNIVSYNKHTVQLIKQTSINESYEVFNINTKKIKKIMKPKMNNKDKINANKIVICLTRKLLKHSAFNKLKNYKGNEQIILNVNSNQFTIEGVRKDYKKELELSSSIIRQSK